jgi:hypothetical protein
LFALVALALVVPIVCGFLGARAGKTPNKKKKTTRQNSGPQ